MKNKPLDLKSYFTFLRAVAIIGIFSYHGFDATYGWGSVGRRFEEGILQNLFAYAGSLGDYFAGAMQLALSFGSTGVELFIMASGFGLYLSYQKRKRGWKSFYLKRGLRILPLYWAALLLFYFDNLSARDLSSLLSHFLLLQNFTPYYLNFGAFWFVSYISFLYLLFPIFVRIFEKPAAKWFLFAGSFFLTPLLLWAIGISGLEFAGGEFPSKYLALFLAGMLVAEYYQNGKSLSKLLNPAFSAIALVLLIVIISLISQFPPLYPYLRIVFGLLLFWVLYIVYIALRPFSIARKITSGIAYASYVIFLLHVGILYMVIRGFYSNATAWTLFQLSHLHSAVLLYLEYFILIALVSFFIQKSYDALASKFISGTSGLAVKPELG